MPLRRADLSTQTPVDGPYPPIRISVITAAYRSAATVGEAIASVARQSHPWLEHVIVEGNSGDDTLAAIQRAAHGRMRLISEPDGGIYDALNKGIARSSGEVIGFVHSDDHLAHDRVLSRIAAAFADPAVEAVFGDLDYVAKADLSRVVRHWSAGEFHRSRLARGWMPPHPTLYLRRSVYDRCGVFDTGFRIAADYDFILRYFAQARAQPVYIPEVLYKMRLGGVSNRDWGRIRLKMSEDYRALRRNRVGGLLTLANKNVSKVGQFLVKRSPTAAG